MPFDLSGGGSDLVFPHHEMSAAQSVALGGGDIFAHHYAHQAMVGLDGEKMSKSRATSSSSRRCASTGSTPWSSAWCSWTITMRRIGSSPTGSSRSRRAAGHLAPSPVRKLCPEAEALLAALRERLADDLDSRTLAAMDAWAARSWTVKGRSDRGGVVARALDALLGVRVKRGTSGQGVGSSPLRRR